MTQFIVVGEYSDDTSLRMETDKFLVADEIFESWRENPLMKKVTLYEVSVMTSHLKEDYRKDRLPEGED